MQTNGCIFPRSKIVEFGRSTKDCPQTLADWNNHLFHHFQIFISFYFCFLFVRCSHRCLDYNARKLAQSIIQWNFYNYSWHALGIVSKWANLIDRVFLIYFFLISSSCYFRRYLESSVVTASVLTPSHTPRRVVCGGRALCESFVRRMSVGLLVCMRAHLAEVITETDDRNSWL